MKSIMQDKKECFITRCPVNLHEHHIFYGTGKRKLSEKYGLKVWLKADLHNMSNDGVHQNPNGELDLMLKKSAQRKFEEVYPDLDFKTIFGKNYL